MPRKKTPSNKRPLSLSGQIDIIPDQGHSWDYLLNRLARMAQAYGFLRAEPALLEDYDLYENIDIEHGGIINFPDPNNSRVAIRPEVLPGLMRSYFERKNIPEGQKISKWYYISPTAVYNEQQGKFISSWEYGFELFGEFVALNEVQVIGLMWKFLKLIGFENVILEVNSIGKAECRKDYDESLRTFLQNKKYELCNECVATIETYPLQVFRCKNLGCKTVAAEAPQVVDFLDEDCNKHFTHVLEGLDELGITYSLNPMLVGREGTSQVTFALKHKDKEGQSEQLVGEGSGHEEIYEAVTAKKSPAFGFVGNLEVLRAALSTLPVEHIHINEIKPEVFLVPLGELAAKKALRLFSELWDENIAVHDHFGNIGVKNQLKMAENSKALLALIIGQKEAMDEMVILRDVKSGMQEIFQYEKIIEEVKKRLGR